MDQGLVGCILLLLFSGGGETRTSTPTLKWVVRETERKPTRLLRICFFFFGLGGREALFQDETKWPSELGASGFTHKARSVTLPPIGGTCWLVVWSLVGLQVRNWCPIYLEARVQIPNMDVFDQSHSPSSPEKDKGGPTPYRGTDSIFLH